MGAPVDPEAFARWDDERRAEDERAEKARWERRRMAVPRARIEWCDVCGFSHPVEPLPCYR